jgi:hypothetical protein
VSGEKERGGGFTPTRYVRECDGCHRSYLISQEALDLVMADFEGSLTEEEAADTFQFCVECISGVPCPEERDGLS